MNLKRHFPFFFFEVHLSHFHKHSVTDSAWINFEIEFKRNKNCLNVFIPQCLKILEFCCS